MPDSRKCTRRRVLTIAIVTSAGLTVAALGQSSVSAGGPGERRVVAESRFDVTSAPLQAEVVQLVVDFPPGAWTSWHTHGGQAINLVLEGEITLRHAGMERPYRAGQAWTDSSGHVHAAGNTGSGTARLLTNFLLPQGAPQTTAVQDSPFEPTIADEARFPLPALPAETEIVQQVVELVPDGRTEQTSVGFTANIVLAGEVTYKIGGERKVYKAGEAWSAPAGTLVGEENRSGSMARVFTTYLLPRGTGR
jgi:quercetin dioxygenase-like cupin family protein